MEQKKNFSEDFGQGRKEYVLEPTELFLEQVDELSHESAKLLEEKLCLAKLNPQRNKRLVGYGLFIFRIRFKDRNREKRCVYFLRGNSIIVCCILDRCNDYKDLRKILIRLGFL